MDGMLAEATMSALRSVSAVELGAVLAELGAVLEDGASRDGELVEHPTRVRAARRLKTMGNF